MLIEQQIAAAVIGDAALDSDRKRRGIHPISPSGDAEADRIAAREAPEVARIWKEQTLPHARRRQEQAAKKRSKPGLN